MRLVALFVVSICTAVVLPVLAIPVLRRAQIIDVPNHRSLHDVPAVRGLGVVSTLGVFAAIITALTVQSRQTHLVVVALGTCVLAALIGLADDVIGLRVKTRLLAQALVATGVGVTGHLLFEVTWWALPFTIVSIVGYINVANFMDGVNGISCLHGVVAGLHFLAVGHLLDRPWLMAIASILLAVHLGMFPWNLRGRAFLGDVGSYLLGSLVAICGLGVAISGGSLLLASAPALVYLTDAFATIVRRLAAHERLTEAHRSHVYQRLVSDGLTHLQSATIVSVWTAVCSVIALFAADGSISTGMATLLVVLVLCTYLGLPRLKTIGTLRTSA